VLCGDDIHDNGVTLLLDEENDDQPICYSCMRATFKPQRVLYALDTYDLGEHDGIQLGAVYCPNECTKRVEWYVNANCGLGHHYMIIIHYDASSNTTKKSSIKLTT
jgi:hypothetical protein